MFFSRAFNAALFGIAISKASVISLKTPVGNGDDSTRRQATRTRGNNAHLFLWPASSTGRLAMPPVSTGSRRPRSNQVHKRGGRVCRQSAAHRRHRPTVTSTAVYTIAAIHIFQVGKPGGKRLPGAGRREKFFIARWHDPDDQHECRRALKLSGGRTESGSRPSRLRGGRTSVQ